MFTVSIDPVLIHLGPFAISWYGLAVAAGILVGGWLTTREAQRRGLSADSVWDAMTWIIVGGLIGARLLFVLDRWPFFAANPEQLLAVQKGGISIMGAILGGGLAGGMFLWRRGLPIRRFFDAAAPGVILGMAIGRFGCLVTGDTVGRPTDGSWGIAYTNPGAHAPQLGVAFQPSFLYEQVWDVLIFLLLWSLRGRIKTDGYLFALFLGLYAAGKFVITFTRIDPVWLWGLQQSHFVALGLGLVALVWAWASAQQLRGRMPQLRRA
jgi:phosphatidylglycerol:prolipoprotein diacylglycerol transferase